MQGPADGAMLGSMEKRTITDVPVLIVGGGPVGLSAALLLARHGVQSLLVERHATTSRLPKARLVNTRTMEVFRQCGIESDVRAAGLPPSKGRYLIRARSVSGQELDRREATFTAGAQALLSPTTVLPMPCGLKAYAGAAPITRASGKKLVVLHRKVKNQRLAAVGYLWTFAALRLSTGARAHYDRRRVAGDRHAAAQRNLFNRFLGCLYYCLQTGQTYAESQAFPVAQPIAA